MPIEIDGIINACIFLFGFMGFVFGLSATTRLNKLEAKLKELKVLDKDYVTEE